MLLVLGYMRVVVGVRVHEGGGVVGVRVHVCVCVHVLVQLPQYIFIGGERCTKLSCVE